MALATQCPHCGTVFRVAADQLKLRGGIVRCGACQLIFDGNAGLVDLDKASQPAPAAAPAAAPEAPAATAPDSSEPPVAQDAAPGQPLDADAADAGEDRQPVYTLELDRTFSPHGILPQAAPAAGVSDVETDDAAVGTPVALSDEATEAQSADTTLLERPVEEAPEDAPAPSAERQDQPEHASAPEPAPARADDAPPLLLRESAGGSPPIAAPAPPVTPRARAAEARARRSKLTPTRIEESPKLRVPDSDEPEFVRRGRQREQSGKARRIALALGSLVLLLALGAQAVVSFRDVLAARYPALRPALVSSCALLGCSVRLPTRPDQLVIETGELITLGGNAYTFSTLLRNQGDMALAWPSIELTLNDADDKPLVRRVFGPRDYAGAAATSPTGFGARAEQPVKIHFRLEGLEPSGYHIAVFYP
jgi:predicted Zn finger-like uncharacterized protein